MIELKPIQRMMSEYKILLEKYEPILEELTISEYKRLIGEIKMFWYRNQKYVDYFVSHITEDDEVAFLAGAVRLDIVNNGHYEYILVGKKRLINDPLLKMATFYSGTEDEINFEYTNKYLRECIQDMLLLFREYTDDFYILPTEFVKTMDGDEYHTVLVKTAENMILSMFSVKYNNVQEFYAENGDIMPIMKGMGEAQLFFLLVSQYCMQAIGIVMMMKSYHMIPFIRNDVVFQYFTLLFHSNVSDEFLEKNYLDTYIPYVVQKAFDFSDKEYAFVRDCIGNGKMINVVENSFEKGKIPTPKEIVKCVEAYIKCL